MSVVDSFIDARAVGSVVNPLAVSKIEVVFGLSGISPCVPLITVDIPVTLRVSRYRNGLLTSTHHGGSSGAAVDGHHGRNIFDPGHAYVAVEGAELRRQEERVRRSIECHRSRTHVGVMIGR